MPMSAAAMSGIQVHGHRWRLEISYSGQVDRLGDVESLKVGDCAAIRDHVVNHTRAWLKNTRVLQVLDEDDRYRIGNILDDLEMCEDDPDELRVELNNLYDQFDFLRVCVVR